MNFKRLFSGIWLCIAIASLADAQDVYTVQPRKVLGEISPTLWGLFFEDINRGADGGLYAELVKNRSFDFPKPMTAWETWPNDHPADGVFVITDQYAANAADPKYMTVTTGDRDTVGLVNAGYDGICLKKGLAYHLTLRYRQQVPGMKLKAVLLNKANRNIGEQQFELSTGTGDWQVRQLDITASDSAAQGKLLIRFTGAGKIDLDRVSLFPRDTWKGRPGGLRADLVQKLFDLHPGFLRFPGGCIVEGNTIPQRYQWKKTLGAPEDRPLLQSIWADNIPERPDPEYMQTFGIGFYEYFQLCEDIGAAPLPIINCGMSCQFDAGEVVPVNQLEPYITDALDLVEFANGDTTTAWGKVRGRLGHPAPFHLTMMGVGNENWGPQYAERLAIFTRRLKARYPGIKLVNASGYSRMLPQFTYMDSVLRARHADIIDEHFYSSPEWFMRNAARYDHYDRKGPQIMVGEYAAQSERAGSLKNVNNLKTALAEACFMTGIERNADIVTMASYAPLFAHLTGWQWTPDLIWFDNAASFCTPNYYIQQLFSLNKGSQAVPLLKDNLPLTGQDSCWASAVTDERSHELVIKLVNMSASAKQKKIVLAGARLQGTASLTTLGAARPDVVNSIGAPDNVKPETGTFPVKGTSFWFTAAPYSLSVVRVKFLPVY